MKIFIALPPHHQPIGAFCCNFLIFIRKSCYVKTVHFTKVQKTSLEILKYIIDFVTVKCSLRSGRYTFGTLQEKTNRRCKNRQKEIRQTDRQILSKSREVFKSGS